MTTRWDFAPDVCKDYKETGYCSFGDTCKFLHDRGDYKRGWEIDAEWEEKMKAAKEAGAGGDEGEYFIGSDDDEELPFACHICRKPFTNPVETRCKHFFCEKCALRRYSKKGKAGCAICGKPTLGIFNINEKFSKKVRERAQRGDDSDEESS